MVLQASAGDHRAPWGKVSLPLRWAELKAAVLPLYSSKHTLTRDNLKARFPSLPPHDRSLSPV